MDSDPVVYYVMGMPGLEAPDQEWREAQTWPPFDVAPTPYYLQPEGILSTGEAAAGAFSSTYIFDPETPFLRGAVKSRSHHRSRAL